jgi:hypothetical protein
LIDALSAVLARIFSAIIDVVLAMLTVEAWDAVASVVVDQVDALSSILARFDSALIDVDFAVFSFESSWALAFVSVDLVVADTIVEALFSCLQLASSRGSHDQH